MHPIIFERIECAGRDLFNSLGHADSPPNQDSNVLPANETLELAVPAWINMAFAITGLFQRIRSLNSLSSPLWKKVDFGGRLMEMDSLSASLKKNSRSIDCGADRIRLVAFITRATASLLAAKRAIRAFVTFLGLAVV